MAATSIKSKHGGTRLLPSRELLPAEARVTKFPRSKPADIIETLCTLGLAKYEDQKAGYFPLL